MVTTMGPVKDLNSALKMVTTMGPVKEWLTAYRWETQRGLSLALRKLKALNLVPDLVWDSGRIPTANRDMFLYRH
jgi:hypothetical protein